MGLFLDTRGNTKIAIAICDRCKRKFPYSELRQDPNYPGLWVCDDDLDNLDPWRLPARETENISLEHPRPDAPISGADIMPVYANQINGVSVELANSVWAPSTAYVLGARTTPVAPDVSVPPGSEAWLPVFQFLCVVPGVSGAKSPNWPSHAGVEVFDGSIVWICQGIYIM